MEITSQNQSQDVSQKSAYTLPEKYVSSIYKLYPHTLGYVASSGKWLPYRWVTYVSKRIANAVARGSGRLIINAAPRFGKSKLMSHWTPAWYLENWPNKRVILCSYGHELATAWGRAVRNELSNNELFTCHLSPYSHAAHRFNTGIGEGGMYCSGLTGSITGFGGNLILIDDPHKSWEEGTNPCIQQKVYDWYTSTLRSRLEPEGTVVLLMTRWDEDDLTGRLLQEFPGEWEHIVLPAIAKEGDILGRYKGESLCPQRYDEAALDTIRHEVTESVWQASYQQEPIPGRFGRACANFSSDNIDPTVKVDPYLPLDISMDFNIAPGMHVVIGQHNPSDGTAYALHEIYEDRMGIMRACVAAIKWCKQQVDWMSNCGTVELYGDASGYATSRQTEQSDYDQTMRIFKSRMVPYVLKVPRKAPSQKTSLAVVNMMMRDIDNRVRYRIHPDCKILISDCKYLKLGLDGKILKDKDSLGHCIDAERYRLYYLYGSTMGPARDASKIGGRISVRAR